MNGNKNVNNCVCTERDKIIKNGKPRCLMNDSLERILKFLVANVSDVIVTNSLVSHCLAR